jgi:hypothetical protein
MVWNFSNSSQVRTCQLYQRSQTRSPLYLTHNASQVASIITESRIELRTIFYRVRKSIKFALSWNTSSSNTRAYLVVLERWDSFNAHQSLSGKPFPANYGSDYWQKQDFWLSGFSVSLNLCCKSFRLRFWTRGRCQQSRSCGTNHTDNESILIIVVTGRIRQWISFI